MKQLIERRAQPVCGRHDSAVLYDLAYTTFRWLLLMLCIYELAMSWVARGIAMIACCCFAGPPRGVTPSTNQEATWPPLSVSTTPHVVFAMNKKASEPRFSTCPAARHRRPCASPPPRLLTYHAEMRPDS